MPAPDVLSVAVKITLSPKTTEPFSTCKVEPLPEVPWPANLIRPLLMLRVPSLAGVSGVSVSSIRAFFSVPTLMFTSLAVP